MVVKFGVPASEYWGMTPAEVGIYLESNRPKHVGGIHEDDIDKMLERRHELESQGVKVL